ncbi:unnamed protein product [Psylliodes chrysocephalus]|uniref:Uncharacterized protein n=1 Tax=Psylliodes chrysocephalus TaxID=3402493 RepID=A0A9P0CSP3_9CUCU|nr:unnamed protein product [Psylliodes chrysocephala]
MGFPESHLWISIRAGSSAFENGSTKYFYLQSRERMTNPSTPIKNKGEAAVTPFLSEQEPSTSKLDPELPSQFKRVVLWPEKKNPVKSARLREKLPAVVTSPQMMEYYKKKENKKIEAEKQKEANKRAREIKKAELEMKKSQKAGTTKKKRVIESVSSDESSESMSSQISLHESDASDWNEMSDEEEEVSEVKSFKNLVEGDFILVEYKGGKRMLYNFIYLCVIQKNYLRR